MRMTCVVKQSFRIDRLEDFFLGDRGSENEMIIQFSVAEMDSDGIDNILETSIGRVSHTRIALGTRREKSQTERQGEAHILVRRALRGRNIEQLLWKLFISKQ